MKERIARLLGNGLETKLILGTFHSVCRRYLVSYGHLIGIRKGFGIADSGDSLSIVKRIIKRLGFNIEAGAARSRISSSKAKGIGYEELALEATKKKNVDQQEFVRVYEEYEIQLASSNLLDYDDLLLRCVDLLRQHPECVSNVEAVLIDEFQDTNVVQFDLMRLFAAKQKRITTVGDPDQSIYGWRSAEIKNLKRMQKQYPDTLVVHLEDNYRSSGAILLAALDLIQQDESRPPKLLLPTHCPGTSPVLRRLQSAAIEALWIVSEIRRCIGMTGNLLCYSDFAILLRTAALSRHVESAMGKAGIPYRMVGGQRFFDRIEIKILLDYLRTVSQPDNNDALARIINTPPRRIGEPTIKALLEEAEAKKVTLWNFVRDAVQGLSIPKTKLSKPAEQGLGNLINIILTARTKMQETGNPLSPEQLLQYIMKKLDFQTYLGKAHPEDHENRWANVEELLAQASDCPSMLSTDTNDYIEDNDEALPIIEGLEQGIQARSEEALSKFLANVALSSEVKSESEEDEEGPKKKVIISTIHAAKGLEWPVVFIPAVYEGSIPHSRAEDTDEERRLLYVAMTRAQALLYMSCPMKNSQGEETTLSPFLSSKKLTPYLVNKGPSFTQNTAQDMSLILRRHCPAEQELIKCYETAENTEDDLWPTNGEEDPETVESRWDKWDGAGSTSSYQHIIKRRKITNDKVKLGSAATTFAGSAIVVSSTYTSVTMQNSSTFSINNTNSGFISAASHLQRVGHQKNETGRRISSIANSTTTTKSPTDIQEARRQSQSKANVAKTSKRPETQGSLMSYWTRSSNNQTHARSKETPATLSLGRDHSLDTLNTSHALDGEQTSNAQSDLPTLPRLPTSESGSRGEASRPNPGQALRASMLPIPPTLANHKIRPIPNITRPHFRAEEESHPKKNYVFLSSSPPRVQDQSGSSDTMITKTNDMQQENNMPPQAATKCNDSRPAATFHTTSISQVQAASTVQKKTLGVRRSMNGWSNRGGQGFSVPGRTRHDG